MVHPRQAAVGSSMRGAGQPEPEAKKWEQPYTRTQPRMHACTSLPPPHTQTHTYTHEYTPFPPPGRDFYVCLERPGYRVARRRRQHSRVGVQHRVTREDAIKWFQQKFEGVVLNKAYAG